MTRGILLAVLLAFSFSTVSIAAPAMTVIVGVKAPAKKAVKKEEKKEAPVTYKKPTRKKVVKK
jgi:hypothetical protein